MEWRGWAGVNMDIIAEVQQRHWQAYCAAEHAKAVALFGPFIAWCIWPYKVLVETSDE